MTKTELTELLHRHVEDGDPGDSMAIAAVIDRGRRTVRRRRVVGSTLGVAVLAAAIVLVPTLRHADGSAGSRIDPATSRALANYDAAAMPHLIDERTRAALAGSVDLPIKPDSMRFLSFDSSGQLLQRKKDWDAAASMEMEYDGGDHRYRVYLAHSGSEAEGDLRQICASNLSGGYAYSCSVDRTDAGLATTTVSAVLPLSRADAGEPGWGWAAVTSKQVARGVTPPWLRDEGPGSYRRKLDPSSLWFVRTVKVVHSQTFVTSTSEYVHASSYGDAQRMWKAPASSLTALATDPVLVIPEPKPRR